MSSEFLVNYSAERADDVCYNLNRQIEQSGSVSDYLLELQVEQARTPDGRAELMRLQRTGAYITAENSATELELDSPATQAFYHGGLLASAVLRDMSWSKEFHGGTLINNFLNKEIAKKLSKHDFQPNSADGIVARDFFLTEFRDSNWVWAYNRNDPTLDTIFTFADKHLTSLHADSDNLQESALLGFWIPLRKVFKDRKRQHTAHSKAKYVPDDDDLLDVIGEMPSSPQLVSIQSERKRILKAFYDTRTGINPLVANPLTNEYTKYAALQHEIHNLNSLNRNSELIAPGEVIQASGVYYCTITDSDSEEVTHKMLPSTEVFGEFDSITIMEMPSLMDFMRAEDSRVDRSEIEMIPTPALILKNPTYIANEDHGRVVTTTDGTTITVPLAYRSARLSRLV